LVVGRGLRPLNLLSQQLRDKPADDLAPVSLPEQPRELEPVIVAMNQWLARLEAAFVRERHFASDAAHELRTPISTLKVHLHNL
ncbi:two-component sensor histidine kinase, partial [Acinetobacter baumannii]